MVITELDISEMNNGFEFQRHVTDEFQPPMIMMSCERGKSVMSNSLENGAANFMTTPICGDDFGDMWQYGTPGASKDKAPVTDEALPQQGANIVSQGDNFPGGEASSGTSVPKGKRKYTRRIVNQVNDDKEAQSDDGAEGFSKKSKVVWTTQLHNHFLMAIRNIGLENAVPKKILEFMNVPGLTRENIASHLQKYRIFLKKVSGRGIIEGISDRTLRSRFASELPVEVIKELKASAERLKLPVYSYLRGQAGGLHHSHPSISNSANGTSTTTLLGRAQHQQPPNLMQGGNNRYNDALKQVRLGKSTFGSKLVGTNILAGEENMSGSYASGGSIFDEGKSSYNNAGPVFPAFGMERGLLTTSKALTGGSIFGEPMHQTSGSLGNQTLLSYGHGNNQMMASLGNSNVPQPLVSSAACYPNIVSPGIGIQINEAGVMNGGGFNSVGETNAINNNDNSFGLMNGSYGTQNASVNVTPPLALEQGNNSCGLIQGSYASSSAYGNVYASELPATTPITNNATPQGNASGIQQLPQQQVDGTWNAAGNENQFNANSMIEDQANQVNDDFSDLFSMLDNVELPNEVELPTDVDEFLNSDFSSSSYAAQFPEEPPKAGDVTVPSSAENNINLPNEESPPPATTDKTPTQGNDDFFEDWDETFDSFFVDNVSAANNSATEQDWDMELIEAMFGTPTN